MDYMTLKETAEKWGVAPRRVNYYCAGERVPGAVKMAGVWLIPRDANYVQTECQFRYCGTAIPFLTVRSTAR